MTKKKEEEKEEPKTVKGAVEQAKCWILTIPATSVKDEEELKERMKPWRWIGQLEKGEQTGYLHYQVGIINDSVIRFETIQNRFKGVHIKHETDRRHAFEYCSKESTRQKGPWRGGDWTDTNSVLGKGAEKGKRADLERVRKAIMDDGVSMDDLLMNPDYVGIISRYGRWAKDLIEVRDRKAFGGKRTERTVTWTWGPSGTGKTTDVERKYGFEDLYEVTDYRNPFDGYAGQSTIFLDEFDGQLPFAFFLKLIDGSPVELPARYQNHVAKHVRVEVASNRSPREVYKFIPDVQRIAMYRRIDSLIESEDGESWAAFTPKRYFTMTPSTFYLWLACYDPDTVQLDGQTPDELAKGLEENGAIIDFPVMNFKTGEPFEDRIIDYDSGVSVDLPDKRSSDEDLDFSVF